MCVAGESHPLHPYWEYLAFLFRKLPVVPEELAAENEYRDYLQAPLQPLQVTVVLGCVVAGARHGSGRGAGRTPSGLRALSRNAKCWLGLFI